MGGIKMQKDSGFDAFILKSGRAITTNNFIIGLCEPEEGEWSIYGGYDEINQVKDFSSKDKSEIADYMIELWTRFKKENCR